MVKSATDTWVLGLDLGVQSIGWTLLHYNGAEPKAIVDAGVRTFEPGMEGQISEGKEESRNKTRRDARLIRRQIDRRARKQRKLIHLLQNAGLLPEGSTESGQERHTYFLHLDSKLYQAHKQTLPESKHHQYFNTFPYWIRAEALKRKLTPYELGRALTHLGQRRGFLSNRKTDSRDEDDGVVKKAISELENAMHDAGAPTLGTYFSMLEPTNLHEKRIRNRYTHRKMYEDEFNLIWDAQESHHPTILTPELKKAMHHTLFFQRPLKSAKDLIGVCVFENKSKKFLYDRKRAPWAIFEAQRFRMLQRVNDLRFIDEYMELTPLSVEQRATLLKILENEGTQTFAQLKKSLGLKKTEKLNLEQGGEKRLPGNDSNKALRDIFGETWDAFSIEKKGSALEDVRSIVKEETLYNRGIQYWKLNEEQAKAFSTIHLQEGYCKLSRQALMKLLPLLEEGIPYSTACKQVYGFTEEEEAEAIKGFSPVSLLPPVEEAPIYDLRNPTVFRVLCEMRKVVNGIIHKYGKPDRIRIELARDMKKNREQRKKIAERMREQEKKRKAASTKILKEIGNSNPKRGDIEKVLLADECGWECPYTGKSISMNALLGDSPQFDVEHIIPFSRSLDNSFLNKTLCYHEENRSGKRNLTPHEAYAAQPVRWGEILERVKRFKGDAAHIKLERFQMHDKELEAFIDNFSSSQLNDTRYASRLAAIYCGMLYGSDFLKHVQVSSGGVTAELRKAWKMNSILNDGGEKTREDHRHHAVDAIAVALTTPSIVKKMSQYAQQAEKAYHRRWWNFLPLPWDTFLDDLKFSIDKITVSRAVRRRVSGALHEQTHYSPRKIDPEGASCVHVRKRIDSLSTSEVQNIVDDVVRQCVLEALERLEENDPKKAFQSSENLPYMKAKNGKLLPIKKVRIRKKEPTFTIGQGERERYVANAGNHHVEILETVDNRGNTKWEGVVVSMFEAMRRKSLGIPIIQRDHGAEKKFLFSLHPGDSVFVRDEKKTDVYTVSGISQYSSGQLNLDFKNHCDARPITKVPRQGRTRTPDTLRKSQCRKLIVTPIGEVRWASD